MDEEATAFSLYMQPAPQIQTPNCMAKQANQPAYAQNMAYKVRNSLCRGHKGLYNTIKTPIAHNIRGNTRSDCPRAHWMRRSIQGLLGPCGVKLPIACNIQVHAHSECPRAPRMCQIIQGLFGACVVQMPLARNIQVHAHSQCPRTPWMCQIIQGLLGP
jgi:hypothetical protein